VCRNGKIYSSQAGVNWLLRKNPDDVIPDGAMIVNEQYAAPAARYQLQGPPLLRGWTIMIKDAKGAKDGWYWDESWAAQCADNNNAPFAVPYGGFGLYCTRCHASAEKEMTFSYTKNIKGFPGEYDTFFVDLSWASEATPPPPPLPGPCDAPESDQIVPTGGHPHPPVDLRQPLALGDPKETTAVPSSSTANVRSPFSRSEIETDVAPRACLAAFCRASRQQKYTAASTSGPVRPTAVSTTTSSG